jgi:hypothetical protein
VLKLFIVLLWTETLVSTRNNQGRNTDHQRVKQQTTLSPVTIKDDYSAIVEHLPDGLLTLTEVIDVFFEIVMRSDKVYFVLKGSEDLSLGNADFTVNFVHFVLVKRLIVHRHSRNNVVVGVANRLKSTLNVFNLAG